MGLTLLTRVYDPFDDTPETWCKIKVENRASARVTCANGHTGSIHEHDIGADGTVTPSVVCTECDWHVFVRLVGWKP